MIHGAVIDVVEGDILRAISVPYTKVYPGCIFVAKGSQKGYVSLACLAGFEEMMQILFS